MRNKQNLVMPSASYFRSEKQAKLVLFIDHKNRYIYIYIYIYIHIYIYIYIYIYAWNDVETLN